MEATTAWVLNLDADVELGRGPNYCPSARILAAMRPHVETLARTLLGPRDILVDEGRPNHARGHRGRAFCPTPRAVAALARAGAAPEASPTVEILRRVNGRAFAAGLGSALPGAAFVTSLDEAIAMLRTKPERSAKWRVKRAFGMAGRGQRVVDPDAPTEADLAALRAGIQEGGVQIEPHLRIVKEYALHGMVSAEGALTLGRICAQRCDALGQWLATEPAPDIDAALATRLTGEAKRVAAALTREGYFGPFNVDSFEYVDGRGVQYVQPCSDINARYSMGFPVGFGVRGAR